MKRNPLLISCSLALLFVVVFSCSIKEDRRECPCYLEVDLSELSAELSPEVFLSIEGEGGFSFSKTITPDEFGSLLTVKVPRTGVGVQAYYGAWAGEASGRADLSIPLGSECPPLYLHYSYVDTSEDVARDTVRLHKDYCLLDVTMLSSDGEFPFSVAVIGRVDGYEDDGRPHTGRFDVRELPTIEGRFLVRIPRQNDNSLILEIYDDEGVLRRFALGEYIASSGYDWSAPDLRDIAVKVDYSKIAITVSVGSWSETFSYDIEI
ncbi:MAG: hypothetical protein MJY56_03215 [Bacteroidales bacterium]|nr:hypothetical protein [Bacteroidales bacterium]